MPDASFFGIIFWYVLDFTLGLCCWDLYRELFKRGHFSDT